MSRLLSLDLVDEEGRHYVPDVVVAELGERILELYEQLCPAYTGRPARVGKKSLIHFYKAAVACRDAEMTAEAFVKHQLEGMARIGKFWPNAIASPVVTGAVSTHHISDEYVVTYYKSQLVLFLNHARIYGPRDTIGYTGHPFSPLFRCTVAAALGFTDVIKPYREEALLELHTYPTARDILGTLLGFLDDQSTGDKIRPKTL